MKKLLTSFSSIVIFTLAACAPQMAAPVELNTIAPTPTQAVATIPATTVDPDPASSFKSYTNSQFGLGFQFPGNWYGPDEYISDSVLRVAVGSDVVYPYGEAPDQPSNVTNSYLVVLQYSRNDQNTYWKDNYQALTNLQDGESFSDGRGLIIRMREIQLGRFKGFEYIATLSDNAQTEASYSREVILVDDQANLITISGRPNNVEVPLDTEWRDVYKTIDEQNVIYFHQIVDSITVQ